MPETVILPKETSQALTELTGEPRTELALAVVMRDFARHKMQELAMEMHQYETKYGMSFEEYQENWEQKDARQDYSYEAETDYLQWEALFTRHKRLKNNFAWMP